MTINPLSLLGSVVTNPLATYVCTLTALLLIVCVLAAILYFKRRHGKSFSCSKQKPVRIFYLEAFLLLRHLILGPFSDSGFFLKEKKLSLLTCGEVSSVFIWGTSGNESTTKGGVSYLHFPLPASFVISQGMSQGVTRGHFLGYFTRGHNFTCAYACLRGEKNRRNWKCLLRYDPH